MPTTSLPAGRHLALTWGFPEQWGGMTSAMLHRSRSFVAAGAPVDILTLDDRDDLPGLERRMRDDGLIVDGIRLLNLWDWLREHDIAPGGAAVDETHEPLPIEGRMTERLDARGERDAVDRRRDDGSLLMTGRRRDDGGWTALLYDRDGRAVRRFGSLWGVYRLWLDLLTDGEQSWLIVDSKTAARFVRGYRREHVVTMHVVHGSHRDGAKPRASRKAVFDHLADYDSIVLLTERQRDDVLADHGPQRNLAVIPNGRDLDAALAADLERPRGRGVMLASLSGRKRVPHAVEAVAAASLLTEVTLDVYGDGDRREKVEQAIASRHAESRVRLHGHVPDAAAEFRSADFSLLTSTSEGLPLVLAESMAAGCVPIAYDIDYGPSDLIHDGREGFLVPAGDRERLAERIAEFVALPERRALAMRKAARRRSLQFTDDAVVAAWNREMIRARARKNPTKAPEGLRARIGRLKGLAR